MTPNNPASVTPLQAFRYEGFHYGLYIFLPADRVELHNDVHECLLTFDSDSNVVEGKNGRNIGRFSVFEDNWVFWPVGADKCVMFSTSLVDAEVEVSKMFLKGEL